MPASLELFGATFCTFRDDVRIKRAQRDSNWHSGSVTVLTLHLIHAAHLPGSAMERL